MELKPTSEIMEDTLANLWGLNRMYRKVIKAEMIWG